MAHGSSAVQGATSFQTTLTSNIVLVKTVNLMSQMFTLSDVRKSNVSKYSHYTLYFITNTKCSVCVSAAGSDHHCLDQTGKN